MAWLIGTARHKLVDHWRRQEREQRSLRLVDGAAVDDPWDVQLDPLLVRPRSTFRRDYVSSGGSDD